MPYLLIIVSPVGTMICSLTYNYMEAETVKLDPGYMAFVVEAKSFQAPHQHPFPPIPTVKLAPSYEIP